MQINALRKIRWVLLAILCCLLLFSAALIFWLLSRPGGDEGADSWGPEVTIPQGKLRGLYRKTYHGRDISWFLGIPYAEAPIGDLRFRAPVKAQPWNGTLDATVDSAQCPQRLQCIDDWVGSEDCLHLNLYTPKLFAKEDGSLLPTIVYIFGGMYRRGTTLSSQYSPEYLLEKDVVFVDPNYRVGAFGFMSTGDETCPGNFGLKDLVVALEWVRDNIEYFGGDPNRVTLMGHSSGAIFVELMALSPLTEGLFHRYISQSGSALTFTSYGNRTMCKQRAFQLGAQVGCSTNNSHDLVECLRRVEVGDLINGYRPFVQDPHTELPIVWTPVIEPRGKGAFLTERPADLVASGGMRDLPRLTGVAKDEGLTQTVNMYNDEDSYDRFLESPVERLILELSLRDLPINQTDFTENLMSYYLNDLTVDKGLILENITALVGDVLFKHHAWVGVQRHVSSPKRYPTFFYSFDYEGIFTQTRITHPMTNASHVSHGDELFLIFGPLLTSVSGKSNETLPPSDLEMGRIIIDLWTSFATDGVPRTSIERQTFTWRPYDPRTNNVLHIGSGKSVDLSMQYTFYEDRMRFLTKLYSKFGLLGHDLSARMRNSHHVHPIVRSFDRRSKTYRYFSN